MKILTIKCGVICRCLSESEETTELFQPEVRGSCYKPLIRKKSSLSSNASQPRRKDIAIAVRQKNHPLFLFYICDRCLYYLQIRYRDLIN